MPAALISMRSGRKQRSSPLPPRAPKGSVRVCVSSRASIKACKCGMADCSTINTGNPLRRSRSRLPVSISAGKRSPVPSFSTISSMFQRRWTFLRRRSMSSKRMAPAGASNGGESGNRAAMPAAAPKVHKMHMPASAIANGLRAPVATAAQPRITSSSAAGGGFPSASAASVQAASSSSARSSRLSWMRSKASCTITSAQRSIKRSMGKNAIAIKSWPPP